MDRTEIKINRVRITTPQEVVLFNEVASDLKYDLFENGNPDIEDYTNEDLPLVNIEDLDSHGRTPDELRLYLRDIGQFPLLTALEEVELAQAIEKGKYAATTLVEYKKSSPVPDVATIKALDQVISEGSGARNRMIQSNLRLVVSVAKRYQGRGIQFLDLIQQGNLGLFKAVDKFDWRRGFKFSTYATWWVKQSITRYISETARDIRVPVHLVETISKLRADIRDSVVRTGQIPTPEELAERHNLTSTQVREALTYDQNTLVVSLDKPLNPDEDPLGSVISDLVPDRYQNTEQEGIENYKRTAILEALDKLSPREKRVIVLRFGLDGEKCRTLEEVGQEFGVTRERVRQMEKMAISKLQRPGIAQRLRELLD